jgi:hypothetical protein
VVCEPFGAEAGSLFGLGPVAAAGDTQRQRAMRVEEAEVERREAAHGETDDMRSSLTKRV